jgi:hypothetical protein
MAWDVLGAIWAAGPLGAWERYIYTLTQKLALGGQN